MLAPFLLAQQDSKDELRLPSPKNENNTMTSDNADLEIANFGAGCFWCVEAVFQEVNGVKSVESGYMGGSVKDPSYEAVCNGNTGHAEICRIKFDPAVVSFKELLEVFWKTHDPTTLNRQGADQGTQYRSCLLYTSPSPRDLSTSRMPSSA